MASELNVGTVKTSSQVLVADGSTTVPGVAFGNATTTGVYLPTSATLGLVTGGAERVRIDSAGNVGVNADASGANKPNGWNDHASSHFIEMKSGGGDYDSGLFLDRSDSLGTQLWQDGSTGSTYLDNRYDNNAGNIYFRTKTGGTPVNALTISGAGLATFANGIAVTTGGIQFPATQSASADANTLDDYEEGTWTPSLGGDTTYTSQVGQYTKVGRLVNIRCNIQVDVLGTGSTYSISGLPFTSASTGNPTANAAVGYFASLAVSPVFVSAFIHTGSTVMNTTGITAAGANANSALPVFGNGARIDFTITYYV